MRDSTIQPCRLCRCKLAQLFHSSTSGNWQTKPDERRPFEKKNQGLTHDCELSTTASAPSRKLSDVRIIINRCGPNYMTRAIICLQQTLQAPALIASQLWYADVSLHSCGSIKGSTSPLQKQQWLGETVCCVLPNPLLTTTAAEISLTQNSEQLHLHPPLCLGYRGRTFLPS